MGLSLREWNLASAFEIYVNGQKLFTTGSSRRFEPYGFDAYRIKPIPDQEIATGTRSHRHPRRMFAARLGRRVPRSLPVQPGYWRGNRAAGLSVAHDRLARMLLDWFYAICGIGLGISRACALHRAARSSASIYGSSCCSSLARCTWPLASYRLFHNLPTWRIYRTLLQYCGSGVPDANVLLPFLRIPLKAWLRIALSAGDSHACWTLLMRSVADALGIGLFARLSLRATSSADCRTSSHPCSSFICAAAIASPAFFWSPRC